MNRNRIFRTVLLIMLGALLMAGCGGSSQASYSRKEASAGGADRNYGSPAAPAESAAAFDTAYEGDYEAAEEEMDMGMYNSADSSGEIVEAGNGASSRKLITTVNLTAESDDMDHFLGHLEQKVQSLGGYMESSNVYQNSYDKHRSAEFTIRIPSRKLKEFLSDVEEGTNILRRSTNTEDITLQYTDTESHRRALEAEEKQLLEIMSRAEEISDIITIEEQLTDVRYRLDSIRSQLLTYDNQVDYSTVYLSVEEVVDYTEPPVESPLERIRTGFMESVREVRDFLVEFCVWFVTHIPQLILLAVVLGLLAFLIRVISAFLRKRSEKLRERAALRAEKRAEKKRMRQMKRAGMRQTAGQSFAGRSSGEAASRGGAPEEQGPGNPPEKAEPGEAAPHGETGSEETKS